MKWRCTYVESTVLKEKFWTSDELGLEAGDSYGLGLKASADLMVLIYLCVDDILSHILGHDGDSNGYRAEVFMTTA